MVVVDGAVVVDDGWSGTLLRGGCWVAGCSLTSVVCGTPLDIDGLTGGGGCGIAMVGGGG